MIEVKQLTKGYAGKVVLDQVSFTLASSGITALVGPNGAGKSTLLSMIGRLSQADAGQVLIDGRDVTAIPGRELAQRLAILRQENHIVSRLSVRELVSFGRFPYSQGRLTAEDQQKVDAALGFLDLSALQHRYLDQLSGGQRQRAFVAMVLCQETEYALLDEPLNNLDMQHAVAMMKQIRRAADELGRTIILVIHDINFAAAYADRIIALKQGQLLYDGTPNEIMQPALLEHIFDLPVQVEQLAGQPLAIYYR